MLRKLYASLVLAMLCQVHGVCSAEWCSDLNASHITGEDKS
jgi:hypothetical protein